MEVIRSPPPAAFSARGRERPRAFFSRCSGGGSVLPGRPARPGRLRPVRRRCRFDWAWYHARFDFSSPEREREIERERRRAAPLAAQERRGFAPTMPVVHFLSAASCVPAASIGLLHLIGGERISGFLNPRKDRSRRVLR